MTWETNQNEIISSFSYGKCYIKLFWNYKIDKLYYWYQNLNMTSHSSHTRTSEIRHNVGKKQKQKQQKKKKKKKKKKNRMYLSQNNAYKLNNYPLLLDKKLSIYHRKSFCFRNYRNIPSAIDFQLKHWR